MSIILPVAPDEDTEGGGEAASEEAEAGQDRPRHTDWAAAVSGDQGPDQWPGEAVHTYPGAWTREVTIHQAFRHETNLNVKAFFSFN